DALPIFLSPAVPCDSDPAADPFRFRGSCVLVAAARIDPADLVDVLLVAAARTGPVDLASAGQIVLAAAGWIGLAPAGHAGPDLAVDFVPSASLVPGSVGLYLVPSRTTSSEKFS